MPLYSRLTLSHKPGLSITDVRLALERDYGAKHNEDLLQSSEIWAANAAEWAPRAAYCGQDPQGYRVFVLRKSDAAYLVSCEGALDVFRASQDCLTRSLAPLRLYGGKLDLAELFYEAKENSVLEDDRALLRTLFGREQLRGIGVFVALGLVAAGLAFQGGASPSPAAFTGVATAAVGTIAQIAFAWHDVRRSRLNWKISR